MNNDELFDLMDEAYTRHCEEEMADRYEAPFNLTDFEKVVINKTDLF
jgi:hypothetical protein